MLTSFLADQLFLLNSNTKYRPCPVIFSGLTGANPFVRIHLALRPVRLAAQDVALSRLKQGFDSPTGHHSGGFTPPGEAFLFVT